jgi:hypothetical protein
VILLPMKRNKEVQEFLPPQSGRQGRDVGGMFGSVAKIGDARQLQIAPTFAWTSRAPRSSDTRSGPVVET